MADVKGELRQARQNEVLSPQGTLQCSVYATSLFDSTHVAILDRISGIRLVNYSLRHKIQVRDLSLFKNLDLHSYIQSEQN